MKKRSDFVSDLQSSIDDIKESIASINVDIKEIKSVKEDVENNKKRHCFA